MTSSLQFTLARRPAGLVSENDFELKEVNLPPLEAGDIELSTLYISLDPAIRGWLDDRPSYLPPVQIGDPVRAIGIAQVTSSRNPDFAEGELVRGMVGWQQRQVVHNPQRGSWVTVTPHPGTALTHYLGVLGITGLTAWAGVHDILQPESNDTVLVSGASGAVGSVAVQLAKQSGARVIGIAGGDSKCTLVSELGADVVVDRKSSEWATQLEQAAPDGIDRIFENSGGPMFDKSIALLNNHSRIALCGLIDGYNLDKRPPGPSNFGMFVAKRVLVQGFIALDYADRADEIENRLRDLLETGVLKPVETIVSGFEQIPSTFVRSFTTGSAGGKIIVDVT